MKLEPKSFGCGLAVGALTMLVVCVGLVLAAALVIQQREAKATAAKSYPASAFCPLVGDEGITSALKPIRQRFSVPAMAAAVVTSEGIQFVGAVGIRKRNTEISVTLSDHWHLGSDTKAMTAILMARLVERGQLKWDTTLATIFPQLATRMHPDFKTVTLLHLLSHRAGLPANLDLAKFRGDDGVALRLRSVQKELTKKPRHAPGSHYEYSNLGYIIAGAAGEKITGQSWEHAMRTDIFAPLQMRTVGFGGTGHPGEVDQPWPHNADGEPTAENGPAVDNPPVMGPAGRVHCSIQDWAKFIQDQLRGARGEAALLKSETYQKLHTPPFGGDYALGWRVAQRDWGGGTVFNHTGDNTMNFANVWVAPLRDLAILVCVNQSGDMAFQATDAAVSALIKLHAERTHPQ